MMAYSYWVGTSILRPHTPPIMTMYSCHIRKSYSLYLTNHMKSISHHITPLVINSLRGSHTHKHACRRLHRNNFKKPGTCQLQADACLVQ